MRRPVTNKKYGENLIKLEEGYYSLSDIKDILLKLKLANKERKRMLEKSMKKTNGKSDAR